MSLTLRFVRGAAWDSKLIEWQTRAWCSHVELVSLGNRMTFGSMLKGGVKWRDINDPIYRNVSRWEAWTLPMTPEQDARVSMFIHTTMGQQYDWRAIFAFALGNRDWETSNKEICSEWVMKLLEFTGVARLPENMSFARITPRDVYMIYTVLVGVRRSVVETISGEYSPKDLNRAIQPLLPDESFNATQIPITRQEH